MTEIQVTAPGRANLIGEHTDYNEGLVLPIAIDLATSVTGQPHPSIELTSTAEAEPVDVSITDPRLPASGWGRYVAAVARALLEAGESIHGISGTVTSDVPVGAGLSSSAALEVATSLAIADGDMDATRVAQLCRVAENDYVGVASGIMDQLTCAAARAGHACLIDCRDDSVTYVPLEGVAILLVDSGIRRSLQTSAYNERVDECRRAARAFGVRSLRELAPADLPGRAVDGVLGRRARHVVTENERVLDAAEAFRNGDLAALGAIFEESHRSYSEDFAASTPEIDLLVGIAGRMEGVVAARLTGGGWGGCTVNVVDDQADVRPLADSIVREYARHTGIEARWWVTSAAAGAARRS